MVGAQTEVNVEIELTNKSAKRITHNISESKRKFLKNYVLKYTYVSLGLIFGDLLSLPVPHFHTQVI